MGEALKAEQLERYDGNGDGMLDEHEHEQMREDARRNIIAPIDTDRNGELSEKEIRELREKMDKRRREAV